MKGYVLSREQTASNRMPRRINSNLLFHLIRTRQPISRAELARISGLQRSTVSLIVEGLIADNWIVEGSTGRLPRGRNPTLLQLNRERAILALDIHPTQTTVGVSDLGGKLLAQNNIVLPQDPKKVLTTIVAGVRKVMAAHPQHSFVGVGICLPGRTDLQLKKLIFAPNLTWPAMGIQSRIRRATGVDVAMDNVANACVLSEVWFGGSEGKHDIVVVNVSEGLGTGIFANGQLLRGDSGMAGEFGHVQQDRSGILCSCGNTGCWETLASNRAALRYYKELAPRRAARTYDALLKLAQRGEPRAVAALTRTAVELGRGMRMIASALAPKEIIVVGDITSLWEQFGPVVEAELNKNAAVQAPVLRPSYNADSARLRSAVALVLNEGLL